MTDIPPVPPPEMKGATEQGSPAAASADAPGRQDPGLSREFNDAAATGDGPAATRSTSGTERSGTAGMQSGEAAGATVSDAVGAKAGERIAVRGEQAGAADPLAAKASTVQVGTAGDATTAGSNEGARRTVSDSWFLKKDGAGAGGSDPTSTKATGGGDVTKGPPDLGSHLDKLVPRPDQHFFDVMDGRPPKPKGPTS